jgi:hypothetical protein
VEKGSTILEVAKAIRHGLAKEAVAGKVNARPRDWTFRLE